MRDFRLTTRNHLSPNGVNHCVMPRITLGWSQYLVVIFGLCTIAIAWEIMLEPSAGIIARVTCIGPEVPCQRTGDWDGVLALAARPFVEGREALRRAAGDATTDARRVAAFVLNAGEHQAAFTQAAPIVCRSERSQRFVSSARR